MILRAMLSGCVRAAAEPASGRAIWRAIGSPSISQPVERFTSSVRCGTWRIVAGRYGGLEIDYTAFQGERPSQVVLRGTDLEPRRSRSNQVEVNGESAA